MIAPHLGIVEIKVEPKPFWVDVFDQIDYILSLPISNRQKALIADLQYNITQYCKYHDIHKPEKLKYLIKVI